MTVGQMKRLIVVVAVCCAMSGLGMIWCSFGTLIGLEPLLLVLLGAAAMGAAMRYTLGKNPYGYRGLGDWFVAGITFVRMICRTGASCFRRVPWGCSVWGC